MLEIHDLHVSMGDKPILNGLDLSVGAGEIHAVMGPNGSGKSTLAQVLAGREEYRITAGEILFRGENLLALSPEERARAGLFLGFQNPVEIPGVSNVRLLKEALHAHRVHAGLPPLDALAFREFLRSRSASLGLADDWLLRAVNVGFSGGEKKRNELLQMLVLAPRLAILDEIDSGLDIDALSLVARGIHSLRDAGRAMLLITHYRRLLEYLPPDRVHVLAAGRIVLSGDKALADEIEARGYGWLMEGVA